MAAAIPAGGAGLPCGGLGPVALQDIAMHLAVDPSAAGGICPGDVVFELLQDHFAPVGLPGAADIHCFGGKGVRLGGKHDDRQQKEMFGKKSKMGSGHGCTCSCV